MAKVFNNNAASFGLYGHEYVTDGSYSDKEFYALQAVGGDATLTYTDTAIDTQGAVTHSSKTLPDGVVVYGSITSLTVASGTVIGYLKAGER
jgi:hypothetical protein